MSNFLNTDRVQTYSLECCTVAISQIGSNKHNQGSIVVCSQLSTASSWLAGWQKKHITLYATMQRFFGACLLCKLLCYLLVEQKSTNTTDSNVHLVMEFHALSSEIHIHLYTLDIKYFCPFGACLL